MGTIDLASYFHMIVMCIILRRLDSSSFALSLIRLSLHVKKTLRFPPLRYQDAIACMTNRRDI